VPPAGEVGCEPKPNEVFVDGAGAPKAKGEGWVKVEGLLGAELEVACPNGFVFCGVPKENGEEAVAEVGVVLKGKEPVVGGLCVSSEAFVIWPKENPVDVEGTAFVFPKVSNDLGSSVLSIGAKEFDGAEGTALVCPNPPKALGSSVLSLGAKGFDGDELLKENGDVGGNGEVRFCGPPPNNDVPIGVEALNENPLPKASAGLFASLDC